MKKLATPEQEAEVLRLWVDSELTQRQIGERVGLSRDNVNDLIRTRREKGEPMPRRRAPADPQRDERLVKMAQAGFTNREIAEELGMTDKSMKGAANRLRQKGHHIPKGLERKGARAKTGMPPVKK